MLNGAPQLRQAVSSVVALVDSLRSSVAKGALICLHDLFQAYGKQVDYELDRCATVCLKKSVDTNGWLRLHGSLLTVILRFSKGFLQHDPWVCWETGQVGIRELVRRRRPPS